MDFIERKRQLGVLDGICLVVGIIVGAGIFESLPIISANSETPLMMIALWGFGGVLSLCGAICYAELAKRFPQNGGDYIYLRKSFNHKVAFVYGFTKLLIIRPGSIGAMAFVFGRYANQLHDLGRGGLTIYAFSSVALLGAVNILGVKEGKYTQNSLTFLKIAGLSLIIGLGIWLGATNETTASQTPLTGSYELALIMVLFTFGGWNEIALVAGEIKDPDKNLFRTLVLGTLTVTIFYILVNIVLLNAIGQSAMANSVAPMTDLVKTVLGSSGQAAMSLLICLSCLGAINGMIFTGSRVYSAMGEDFRLFAFFGTWSQRYGTPLRAVVCETLISLFLIVSFSGNSDGFERMTIYTTPVFWSFMILIGWSVLRFRKRASDKKSPFIVGVFLVTSGFMLWSSATYAWSNAASEFMYSFTVLLVGILIAGRVRLIKPS